MSSSDNFRREKLLVPAEVLRVQRFTQNKGRRDTGGKRTTSRTQSGRLLAAEVVSDRRTREVVFIVHLWSEGHGQVNVAPVQRWLDQLLHPEKDERNILELNGTISGWVNYRLTSNTCVYNQTVEGKKRELR